MVEVKVTYNCGCGFKTMDIEEATTHSEDSGHSLAALGSIHCDKNVKKALKEKKSGYNRNS